MTILAVPPNGALCHRTGVAGLRVLYKRNQLELPQLTVLESRWQEIDNPAEAISQRA